jgi:hypothetical protein
MRVQLKGVHLVRTRLADGKVAVYYYAWRGGPRLSGAPGSPEFVRSFHEARAARKHPIQGCLMTLIAEFRGSAEYLGLSPSTRRAYTAYLREIEIEFGDMPLRALESPKARGEFKRWRDRLAATPRAEGRLCVDDARPSALCGQRPRTDCLEPMRARRPVVRS